MSDTAYAVKIYAGSRWCWIGGSLKFLPTDWAARTLFSEEQAQARKSEVESQGGKARLVRVRRRTKADRTADFQDERTIRDMTYRDARLAALEEAERVCRIASVACPTMGNLCECADAIAAMKKEGM